LDLWRSELKEVCGEEDRKDLNWGGRYLVSIVEMGKFTSRDRNLFVRSVNMTAFVARL
jgi:hypothetical protein